MPSSPTSPSALPARLRRHLRLAGLATVSGLLVGTAAWAFLEALDRATRLRLDHPGLVWFLPLAGLAVGLAYHLFGGRAGEGNTLLLREIHEPSAWVPRRMAPMVAVSTVVSHLFGASVGREGSALQMSGSLTDLVNRVVGVRREDRRVLLVAALGGGFGAVFGVPWAGLVFGLEVQLMGRWRARGLVRTATERLGVPWHRRASAPDRPRGAGPSIDDVAGSPDDLADREGEGDAGVVGAAGADRDAGGAGAPAAKGAGGASGEDEPPAPLGRLRAAVVPTAIASFLGNEVVGLLGHHHEARPRFTDALDLRAVLAAVAVGLACGVAAVVFVGASDGLRHRLNRLVALPPLRPVLGGVAVVVLTLAVGHEYLGLSLGLGDAAFAGTATSFSDPAWKLAFTAVCLGTGYIGGEVTPMFVIGATLGAAVGHAAGIDPVVGASLGYGAVFAGAANAPLACTVLAVETFGAGIAPLAIVTCALAFAASGRYGVYHHRPDDEPTLPARLRARAQSQPRRRKLR